MGFLFSSKKSAVLDTKKKAFLQNKRRSNFFCVQFIFFNANKQKKSNAVFKRKKPVFLTWLGGFLNVEGKHATLLRNETPFVLLKNGAETLLFRLLEQGSGKGFLLKGEDTSYYIKKNYTKKPFKVKKHVKRKRLLIGNNCLLLCFFVIWTHILLGFVRLKFFFLDFF